MDGGRAGCHVATRLALGRDVRRSYAPSCAAAGGAVGRTGRGVTRTRTGATLRASRPRRARSSRPAYVPARSKAVRPNEIQKESAMMSSRLGLRLDADERPARLAAGGAW